MESIRNMLPNATEFTLWHIREPYEPLKPKSLNIYHACWGNFFLVDVFQVSNCKWKRRWVYQNKQDRWKRENRRDCKNSNPWLFTLSPWPLEVSSYTLSGLPPWLALVSVTQTDIWTGNGLQALSDHPWESYDQIQGNEPKPASWVLRDIWLSQSCSPSWLHINH